MGWNRGRYDPGPCPVDDTPHTACVPGPDAAPLTSRTHIDQSVRVPFARPGYLRAPEPEPTLAAPIVSAPFTTGEYSHAKHGSALGKGKRRRP